MAVLHEEIADLRRKNEYAMSLKEILMGVQEWQDTHNCTIKAGNGVMMNYVDGQAYINLGDNVPVYVDDLFGGKVIKQEATKAIIIYDNGQVVEGVTKEAPDKGRKYKLVQKK